MKTDLSLYIHIPFCVKKCKYCDFLSFCAGEDEKSKYIDTLIEEIRQCAPKYADRKVVSIYIGGGTPSIINAVDIKRIFDVLRASFDILSDAEISIEINPGTVDLCKLEEYYKYGINRISIGLQSAKDSELRLLGRIHTYDDFIKTYENARKTGFKNINIDLISALPGQSAEDYCESLQKVIELEPEHISAYSLQLEEGTYFFEHRQEYDWPGEETDRQIYAATKKILEMNGYHRYEISNYSKEGFECEHNKVYWKRGNYLGLGLGAASLVDNVRFCNTRDFRNYGKTGYVDAEILSLKDQIEEYMFLGLRLVEGVSPEAFNAEFGLDIDVVYGDVLKKTIEAGLLFRGERIKLTEYGLDISNYVFSEFLLDDDWGAGK